MGVRGSSGGVWCWGWVVLEVWRAFGLLGHFWGIGGFGSRDYSKVLQLAVVREGGGKEGSNC